MGKKQFDFHEIKTFEDACRHLGISEDTELLVTFSDDTEAFLQDNVFYKLMIIQKAINDGVDNDINWNFYPSWDLYEAKDLELFSERFIKKENIRPIARCTKPRYTHVSGAEWKAINFYNTFLSTGRCYPFAFNSPQAALYAGRQFESLFFQYYGIKVKA